jgi:hypothetical protein
MKDNQEQKFPKMLLILKILKVNMKWQKLEEAKVQVLENLKLKDLQKEILMCCQELYKVMTKGKVLQDLVLRKFKENENQFKSIYLNKNLS